MSLPDPAKPLEDPERAFKAILSGGVEDVDIARFLLGLAERGETVDEIVAAVRVLRANMIAVEAPENAIDVCGTGGDGAHTLNISTAVAIVVASCGVPVAKHGNRAASSQSGAADVLSCLGLDLDIPPERAAASIAEIGIGFLFAARHHPVMARVARVRRALGQRTIFNLLGPLANPAGVSAQLVGVFDGQWVRPLAEALQRLGSRRALVVHGEDGLDEISISEATRASLLDNDWITERKLEPADADLPRHEPEAIRGGSPAANARALIDLLDGADGAYRDIVCLNSAAALQVAGRAGTLAEGALLAARHIDDGSARKLFEAWRAFR